MFKFELTKDQEKHALELHKKAIVIDSLQLTDNKGEYIAARYYNEFKEGGITATFNTLTSDLNPYPELICPDFKETILRWDKLRNCGEESRQACTWRVR